MGPGVKTFGVLALAVGAQLLTGCVSPAGSARSRIVKTPSACDDVTVQIYFDADSAEMTDEGRAILAQAATAAKTCRIDKVKVLGLADAAGGPAAGMELSKQRVAAVTRALIANGLPAGEFDLSAAGQQGSTVAGGEARPLRRRADVTLELSAP